VLASILPSNEAHLHRALETVRRTGARSVGILGMTFKPGTDDVRESPSIQLMQKLRAEGFHVRVYDEAATLSTLTGENRRFLLERIPDFGTIAAVDGKALVDSVDVLVVTQNTGAYGDLVRDRRTGQIVIDLVRLSTAREESYSVLY